MTKKENKFNVDLDDKKEEHGTKKELSLKFENSSTSKQLLQIKEQFEIIDSMNITEDIKEELRHSFIYGNIRIEQHIIETSKNYIIDIMKDVSAWNRFSIEDSSDYYNGEQVANILNTTFKLNSFLMIVYKSSDFMKTKIENNMWYLNQNNRKQVLMDYIIEEDEVPEAELSYLYQTFNALLMFAIEYFNSPEFLQKFLLHDFDFLKDIEVQKDIDEDLDLPY